MYNSNHYDASAGITQRSSRARDLALTTLPGVAVRTPRAAKHTARAANDTPRAGKEDTVRETNNTARSGKDNLEHATRPESPTTHRGEQHGFRVTHGGQQHHTDLLTSPLSWRCRPPALLVLSPLLYVPPPAQYKARYCVTECCK